MISLETIYMHITLYAIYFEIIIMIMRRSKK